MRRRRLSSPIIEAASALVAALESLDPAPNLGPGLTVAVIRAALDETHSKQETYNTLLAESDEAKNGFERSEATLGDLTERLRAGVGALYGRDSDAYEMVGGRRKSERKRPVRKPAAPQPPA